MIGRAKCQMCKHFTTKDVVNEAWKCDAFPNEIPEMKIAFLQEDPCINCNNGIGFERAPDDFSYEEK